MKVRYIPQRPPTSAGDRLALSPELTAAVAARYSRNNEGLDDILSRITPDNEAKSIESIFRMVDYGHRSIGDLASGITVFMDGVSVWLIYYLFNLCQTGSGQESSTRYLRMGPHQIPPPASLGLPESEHTRWREFIDLSIEAYVDACEVWSDVSMRHPEAMKLPEALLADPNPKSVKIVDRMRRNYIFDRARVFLPAALTSNVALCLNANGWVSLIQTLLASPLCECQALGLLLRGEIEVAVPNSVRHARCTQDNADLCSMEFDFLRQAAADDWIDLPWTQAGLTLTVEATKPVFGNVWFPGQLDAKRLQHRKHRYSPFMLIDKLQPITFWWEGISFGDLRDLNRHRTGGRSNWLVPTGFYAALDQFDGLPETTENEAASTVLELKAMRVGDRSVEYVRKAIEAGDPTHPYWMLLGDQVPFVHTTTLNHFLYEVELRTGPGTHYRYAAHVRDVMRRVEMKHSHFAGAILEGKGEPE